MESILLPLSKLGQNLALALSLTFLYSLLQNLLQKYGPLTHSIFTGLLFGPAAILASFAPADLSGLLGLSGVPLSGPIQIDSSPILLALSGPFGGLPALFLATTMALTHWFLSAGHPGDLFSLLGAGILGGGFTMYLAPGSSNSAETWNRFQIKQKGRQTVFLLLGFFLAFSELLWTLTRTDLSETILALSYLAPFLFLSYPPATLLMANLINYENLRGITENRLLEEKERLTVTLRSIGDAVISTDRNGKIVLMNEEAEVLTGYFQEETDNKHIMDIFRVVNNQTGQTEDFPLDMALAEDLVAGASGQSALVSRDGEIRNISYILSSIREEGEDRPIGVVLVFRDITPQIQAEKKLMSNILEKEVLLKEIHHRVKNNLQVIDALLDYQSDYTVDPGARSILLQSRNRVKSMALIHEQLYQSRDLGKVDFAHYIENLLYNLKNSYGHVAERIELNGAVEDVSLGVYSAIPCGLIINELASNSLKYAFPDSRVGRIDIAMRQDGEIITLEVSDDGVGIPAEVDIYNTRSLGLQLVHMLTRQLKGSLEHKKSAGGQGACFVINFNPVLIKK